MLTEPWTIRNAQSKLEALNPAVASIFSVFKGKIRSTQIESENPAISFPVNILLKQGKVFLIKSIDSTQKCDFCGDYFKHSHTCNVRRRDYYFHHINHRSSDWWETIQFQPIGALPNTERLFITYDVETYTWHGRFGKQLVPFMLVFHLSGDPALVQLASDIAQNENWCVWKDHTYYVVDPQKGAVGKKFKTFRDQIQKHTTALLWKHYVDCNPHLYEAAVNHSLPSIDDIPHSLLCEISVKGVPKFVEVYVVGHNICGFDEIVLAAQVIHNRDQVLPAFKVTRNFMPRNGKILFNDITFGLPNPLYKVRKNFTDWELGNKTVSDAKLQFVKFMVRDTFALTHSSLRNAATAYDLPVEKGHCPYEAVNDFYRLGSYLQDEDGFPSERYWKNPEEYQLNKILWKESKTGAYDIIRQTLHYCAQDVRVTAALVNKLQESYKQFVSVEADLPDADFNIFQRPTISSNSHAIFKQILYKQVKPQRGNLDKAMLAPSHEMYDYVRQSIRGGRCYPTYIGIMNQPIYVYDICGMYASALTHPFPTGQPLNPYERAIAISKWDNKLKSKSPIDYFDKELLPGIFTIDADPPEEIFLDELPPFCSRKGGRLCWTNEPLRGEVATSVDVITLHNRQWVVRIVPDELTTVFPSWSCLARDYVQLNINAKEKADKEKNQTMRSIAKLLSNALYGSFATKLDNKKILFSDQVEEESAKYIATGKYSIKSTSFIETDNLCAEIMPEFTVAYPPAAAVQAEESEAQANSAPFIPSDSHVTYTYKPITFMDVDDEDICLHTLENNSALIENNRYPSHIASFVLAWTRVFVSEWSDFLYSEDRGKPWNQRVIKSVYGDTDSLFVTEEGHRLMEEKGKHRIKKNGGKLVFDPNNPAITWLVECETQCEKCKSDAYSTESVFLAPKLYALKSIYCQTCGHVGKGKLRAKGHATSELSYDTLAQCYLADSQHGAERFQTSRLSLKRTLATCQNNAAPFTVTETTLTRTVRPWKDRTLVELDQNRLIPYSRSNPNPRNKDVTWMILPWNM